MATYLGHQEDSNGNILLPTPHSMAAQVELGTTASQAYTIGTYLIFNNRLCKATTAIASGDTLAIGTNLVQCSIGSELSSHLQANSNEFYFDYHDGKYGFNTSISRDAATFNPFNSTDHIRLNLYGYAYGWAAMYGTDAEAHTTGSGTYKLSGVEIDHITGISGSMTVSYTNGQGQSVSQSLSAGQTVSIGNSNDVTFSWQNSASQHKHSSSGDASCSVSASVVVDVYF